MNLGSNYGKRNSRITILVEKMSAGKDSEGETSEWMQVWYCCHLPLDYCCQLPWNYCFQLPLDVDQVAAKIRNKQVRTIVRKKFNRQIYQGKPFEYSISLYEWYRQIYQGKPFEYPNRTIQMEQALCQAYQPLHGPHSDRLPDQ